MKQCNIVADGAGARGLYAFAGAIEEIQKHYEIKNFAGVSAGAVVGALVKTGKDLKVVWGLDTLWCDNSPGFDIPLFYCWREDLQIFISDLATGKSIVNDIQNNNTPLYETVFRSMLIPSIFDTSDQYCDGTITSNFPYIGGLNKLDGLNKIDIPTFGLFLYLDEPASSYLHPEDPKNLFLAYFNYVDAQRIHKEHLPNTVKRIIYIPVMDILATNFDLTDEQKEQLYNNGRKAAREFLKEVTNGN